MGFRNIKTKTYAGKGIGILFSASVAIACGGPSPSLEVDAAGADFPGTSASALTFTGTCTFTALSGTVTLTLESGDTVIVSKRVADSAILVNGAPCSTATSANLKIFNVVEGTAGPETLILDYVNGAFGMGSATVGQGTFLNFGTDVADALKIRATNNADTITFGATGINVNGDANKDLTLTASPAIFVVSTGPGADVFSGAGGNGTGGAFTAALTVWGGTENDTIKGGAGADALHGDEGDDTLDAEASALASDVFDGGAGIDTVTYASRSASVTVTVGDLADDGEALEADDVQDTVETVTGGTGADFLSGSLDATKSKTLNGGAGNDTFVQRTAAGPDSHDLLNGGAGTDTVNYSVRTVAVVVTMDGIAANDGSGVENDNIKADVENIMTGAGNDTVTGNALANVISGGAGTNALNGVDGDDTFAQGDDTANGGIDTIDGGNGIDTVDYSLRTNALVVVMDGVVASGDTVNAEADKIKTNVENCTGGSGDDTITGNALDNYLTGGAGDDTLSGLAGNDTLDGGANTATGDTATCGVGSDIAVDAETFPDTSCEL